MLDTTFIGNALIMFGTGFITDVIWAMYIIKTAEMKSLYTKKSRRVAASYITMTGVCTFVFVGGLLISKWLAPFWFAGLWFGTYYSLEVEKFVKKYIK